MILPCTLETEMIIEELEDFFRISLQRHCTVDTSLKRLMNRKAGGLSILVWQVIGSHDHLE